MKQDHPELYAALKALGMPDMCRDIRITFPLEGCPYVEWESVIIGDSVVKTVSVLQELQMKDHANG